MVAIIFGDLRMPERFWSKVNQSDTGCWLFTGSRDRAGYGWFAFGSQSRAHRSSYETLVGPIPAELVIDHLCRTTSCVNPAHLEPVTNRENIMRGTSPIARNAHAEFCYRGHAFTPDNLMNLKSGWRGCRRCSRENAVLERRKKKAGSPPPTHARAVKLTPSLVCLMRAEHATGVSIAELARNHEVPARATRDAVRGHTWKSTPPRDAAAEGSGK